MYMYVFIVQQCTLYVYMSIPLLFVAAGKGSGWSQPYFVPFLQKEDVKRQGSSGNVLRVGRLALTTLN